MAVKKPTRRAKKRFRNKTNKNKVTIMGVNAAGISSKMTSFKNVVRQIQPSIFFAEETKLKRQGKLKLENYVIYELNRKQKNGGGIAIGVTEALKPVWISEGDDNTEVLVVEVDITGFKIRCVGGYGPQEYDNVDKKKAFWDRLSSEVDDALEEERGFILQMDGNLWAGSDLIKHDPNPCNANGKMFKAFLSKHPHLKVVNSLELCEGLITRKRTTKKRTETAVLDFFVVCQQVLQFVERMVVDEDKRYVLSNYSSSKGIFCKTDSDHNTLVLYLSLSLPVFENERKELFNFKNEACQQSFTELTENSSALSKCFMNDDNIHTQANKWMKKLNGFFQQSFRKIRMTKKQKPTKISTMFDKKSALKEKMKRVGNDDDLKKSLMIWKLKLETKLQMIIETKL